MHMGLVNVVSEDDGEVEKMSKSLGNFWTTRDVLEQFDNEAVRYFLLTAHYRKPITYSLDNLEEATQRVEYLYATLQRVGERLTQLGHREGEALPDGELVGSVESTVTEFLPKFEAALADDFNTSKALAVLGELAKAGNELATEVGSSDPNATPEDLAFSLAAIESHMRKAGSILGVLERPYAEALKDIRNLKLKDRDITPEEIDALIAERKEARANEDYERADAIRDELVDQGIELMDKDWGTLWRAR
jgi:cysteinyl-tRNA synthetase